MRFLARLIPHVTLLRIAFGSTEKPPARSSVSLPRQTDYFLRSRTVSPPGVAYSPHCTLRKMYSAFEYF